MGSSCHRECSCRVQAFCAVHISNCEFVIACHTTRGTFRVHVGDWTYGVVPSTFRDYPQVRIALAKRYGAEPIASDLISQVFDALGTSKEDLAKEDRKKILANIEEIRRLEDKHVSMCLVRYSQMQRERAVSSYRSPKDGHRKAVQYYFRFSTTHTNVALHPPGMSIDHQGCQAEMLCTNGVC